MASTCDICLTELSSKLELMMHKSKKSGLWCCVCLISFAREQTVKMHFGNGQYKMSGNHKNRLKMVNEAKPIWDTFHSIQGQMPFGPRKEETLEEARKRNPNIIAPGEKFDGKKGTFPDDTAMTSIHLGGRKNHKVFEEIAYQINAEGDCKTQKFTYGVLLMHCSVYEYLYGREYKEATKEELKEVISTFDQIQPSDAHLHFCRHDCHPLFMRVDVVETYETKKKVDDCEKHLISTSGCFKYWTGGHNNVDEINRMQNRDFRPPTAFYMMAPMDNLANLTKWMEDNGIEKERNYPSDYLFSKKLSPPVSAATTTTSEEEIMEEKIKFLMSAYPGSAPDSAIASIDGLRFIDEKFSSKKPRLQ